MIMNDLGERMEEIWNNIPVHYKEIVLDYHVIMPNHIHGIIIINNVETGHAPSLRNNTSHTLSNVVGSFKSAVTKYAHETGYNNFKWQPLFYDRLIRNEKELYNIRKYIIDNPLKWYYEKNKPENIYEI
jgi:REP element-mobilizing transposase RayT